MAHDFSKVMSDQTDTEEKGELQQHGRAVAIPLASSGAGLKQLDKLHSYRREGGRG